jgi:hypothetical protein
LYIHFHANGGDAAVGVGLGAATGAGASELALLAVCINVASAVLFNCPLTLCYFVLLQTLRAKMSFLSTTITGAFKLSKV